MLVISRKLGEKVYIGGGIIITLVDLDRGKIRLGIEAPRTTPIYRTELVPAGVHPDTLPSRAEPLTPDARQVVAG